MSVTYPTWNEEKSRASKKETNGKYSAEGEFVYKDGTTVKGSVVLKSNPLKSTPKQAETKAETPVQKQPAKPVETPKQKEKKEAKKKAKNTASELSKQLAKLEQMEKELEEAVKNNPDYADTLHSVRTFKNYVQLVRDNYEEMGRPEKVVIDANAIWSINNKLTENLKSIFGNDNVLVLSDEEIENDLNQRNGNAQFSKGSWQVDFMPGIQKTKDISGLSSAIMEQSSSLRLQELYNNGTYEEGDVVRSVKLYGDYAYIWNTDDASTFLIENAIPIDDAHYDEIIQAIQKYGTDSRADNAIRNVEELGNTKEGMRSVIDSLKREGNRQYIESNRGSVGQDSSTSNRTGTDGNSISNTNGEVESDNQFVNDAKQFLSNFGIRINDFSSIDEQAEVFDKLHKVINAKSAEDISDGVGYAIAFMMQHDDTFKDLVFLSTNEGQKDKSIARHLKHEEQKYKRIGKDKKNKYIEEVGKEISKELRKLYNLEPIKSEDSFIQKIWELITKFFDKICNPELKTRIENASNFAKVAAEAVKNNSKELIVKDNIKPGTDVEGERVDIGKALKENPYEESIISLMTDNGIGLGGGASIASVGSLYRPPENPLHDLDFNAYGRNKEEVEDILNNNFKAVKHTNTIANADYTTETYLVMDRDFTEEPSEVSGVLNIVDSNGEIIGTRVNSELILKEGVQGKMLDFFVNDDKSAKHTEVEMNGKKYLFANVDYAMQFKIDVARPKDIFDYARFIKNDNTQEEYINTGFDGTNGPRYMKKSDIQFSRTLSETESIKQKANENLTFNVIDKAIETGEWNQEALDELNNLINDIENGKKIYKRLPEGTIREGNETSEILGRASIILRGKESTTREEFGAREKSPAEKFSARTEDAKEQERIIESWVKANNLWFNTREDATVGFEHNSKFDGSESIGYVNNGGVIRKLMSTEHAISIQKTLDRIALHNKYFPSTPINIVGFTKDNDVMGQFRLVVEQPFGAKHGKISVVHYLLWQYALCQHRHHVCFHCIVVFMFWLQI